MRKVKFTYWQPQEDTGPKLVISEGLFHQWGHSETETFAIIEDEHGNIHEIKPSRVIFIQG